MLSRQRVGSAAETAAAARAGHRSTLPLAAERDSLDKLICQYVHIYFFCHDASSLPKSILETNQTSFAGYSLIPKEKKEKRGHPSKY